MCSSKPQSLLLVSYMDGLFSHFCCPFISQSPFLWRHFDKFQFGSLKSQFLNLTVFLAKLTISCWSRRIFIYAEKIPAYSYSLSRKTPDSRWKTHHGFARSLSVARMVPMTAVLGNRSRYCGPCTGTWRSGVGGGWLNQQMMKTGWFTLW